MALYPIYPRGALIKGKGACFLLFLVFENIEVTAEQFRFNILVFFARQLIISWMKISRLKSIRSELFDVSGSI